MFCDQLVAGDGVPDSTDAYMPINRSKDKLICCTICQAYHCCCFVDIDGLRQKHTLCCETKEAPEGSITMLVWGKLTHNALHTQA